LLDLIVSAAKAMEAPGEQSSAAQNEHPAVRFGVHPNLSKDVHEPTGAERTRDSEQHISDGVEGMCGRKTSAEKANYNPRGDGDPSCHAFSLCTLDTA
jgi:hypothetical protein